MRKMEVTKLLTQISILSKKLTEAHNAEGVLLDSTFQWWNIVFVMFWGVWGYGDDADL